MKQHILEQWKIFGRTIAVLGSGFNNIYPKENEWLFHKILTNCGCIITEYEPDVEPSKEKFPQRNRIVSALSDVVLVIEAEYRSGTSITAKFAKEQGKMVCCLPSNIDSSCGIGTNKLIQGGAKLIMKPSEIVKIIFDTNKNNVLTNGKEILIDSMKEKQIIKTNLPKEYEEIYKIVEIKPIYINDICKRLNKNIAQISSILTMMEIEGYIEQLPGNQFKIKEE